MSKPVNCDINAGMERVFRFLKAGKPCSISRNARFDVIFEVVNANKANEQRFFRVIERSTGKEKLKVPLNDLAGVKPLNGHKTQYEPQRRPNPFLGYPVDITMQRVVCAEINLSADPAIEVYLRIDERDDQNDKRRYLSFKKTGLKKAIPKKLMAVLDEEGDIPDVDLDEDGGKKPLGASDE